MSDRAVSRAGATRNANGVTPCPGDGLPWCLFAAVAPAHHKRPPCLKSGILRARFAFFNSWGRSHRLLKIAALTVPTKKRSPEVWGYCPGLWCSFNTTEKAHAQIIQDCPCLRLRAAWLNNPLPPLNPLLASPTLGPVGAHAPAGWRPVSAVKNAPPAVPMRNIEKRPKKCTLHPGKHAQ